MRYAEGARGRGADAVELNLYRVAADPTRTAVDVEAVDLALVATIRTTVTVPLAVKLSPYYSATANFTRTTSSPKGPTGWCCSTASTSPTSTSSRWRSCPASS